MKKYKLVVTKSAEKAFRKLDNKLQRKVLKSLAAIEENPFIGKKLKGELKEYYSFKTWPLRIIYRIVKQKLEILVVKIGQREGVY